MKTLLSSLRVSKTMVNIDNLTDTFVLLRNGMIRLNNNEQHHLHIIFQVMIWNLSEVAINILSSSDSDL